MTVFKCKMCGGTLEINNDESVAVCEYCGTKQTLPKLDDERRVNLYDRANHFRRNNEFDRAMGIYEQILNEDSSDAEAYWSLVLCRYGIEYVEDPASRKRLPTVNRMQFTSVFDDDNYKLALQYADGQQRSIYEEEAKAINELQKEILAISEKEEPFDVFICYKETDAGGRRTPDAVLANDLYHQLTQEGFKVFFARITLEDKLGTAYEPYIFAALNSAKVMVVLGTKPEYFNAVWVRNEWSRFLALIKGGAKKVLIPAYKDMDPYDLPEEFSHLQAQDMSKLGFMQDLIRGIGKIAQADRPQTTVRERVVEAGGGNIESLLKRAYMFLEDGDWSSADQYCERVLDQDPENAMGYLGKLMAELHVHRQEGLADCAQPFDDRSNYQKAVRFADDKLVDELKGYISHILDRNEKVRIDSIYPRALELMNSANTQEEFEEAARMFESIETHLDSAALAKECHEKGENCRINAIYNNALVLMNRANTQHEFAEAARMFNSIESYQDSTTLEKECHEKGEVCRKDDIYRSAIQNMANNDISSYETAIELFGSIPGWKDAEKQAADCRYYMEQLKADASRRDAIVKMRKNIAKWCEIIVALILVVILAGLVISECVKVVKYKRADAYCDEGEYGKAYNIYKTLNVYGDKEKEMYLILELYAYDLREEGNYEEALAAYKAVRDAGYGDINTDYSIYAVEYYILEEQYNDALALMEEEKYEEALAAFEAMDEFEQGSKAEISRKVNERMKECRLAIESNGMLKQ